MDWQHLTKNSTLYFGLGPSNISIDWIWNIYIHIVNAALLYYNIIIYSYLLLLWTCALEMDSFTLNTTTAYDFDIFEINGPSAGMAEYNNFRSTSDNKSSHGQ